MTIELRDLRWAVIASRHRSLRQAAEALNVRESTLSRRLRDLEYRLGAELFERTAVGTRLTSTGDEFIALATHILAEAEAVFARIRARGRGECGDIVIGICMAFSMVNLLAILAEYGRQHAGVEVHGIDGSRAQLLADLTSGSVDVFLTAEAHPVWDGASLPLWSERVMVALSEDHFLRASPIVRWPDLAGARVLINRRDPGPDYEAMLLARLGEQCGCILIAHEVCLDHLLGFVAAGHGLTLVSESAAGARDSGIVFRELHDDDGPVRIRFAAYWKETNRNPALRPFLDLLRERYSDVAPSVSAR